MQSASDVRVTCGRGLAEELVHAQVTEMWSACRDQKLIPTTDMWTTWHRAVYELLLLITR